MAHVTFSRRNIFKRDHYTCQYCGAQPGSEELTLDHVVPRRKAVCRAGRTACWPAWPATSGRPTGRRSRRACTCGRAGSPGVEAALRGPQLRIDSWAKFVSEAYWNVTVGESSRYARTPVARPGADTGVCSWESKWFPKPPYGVQILALLLIADVAERARRRSCKPHRCWCKSSRRP